MIVNLVLALAAAGAQSQPARGDPPPFRVERPAPPVPAPPVPAPPVLNALHNAAPPEPAIVRFRAGEARCDGSGAERPVLTEEPFNGASFAPPAAPAGAAPDEVRLSFRIAADGRPLGIKAERRLQLPIDTRDVAAAFAAWRFAPGPERSGCTAAFRVEAVPVSRADPPALHRFLALQALAGSPIPAAARAAFRRAMPAGSTCFDPRPNVRLQAFPAFEEIPQPPGTASYSFVGYEIAADGSTRGARIASSSGNRMLDRQSLAAIGRTRYQPGIRKGCNYPFYRRQAEPLRPPPPPEEAAFRPEGATCPAERPQWAHMPELVFPEEFRRRAIEGWAVVRYDVAPWGATGNVTVAASEPAAAFGEQAVRIVSSARKPPGGQGFTGCVVRVIFVLPERDGEPDA